MVRYLQRSSRGFTLIEVIGVLAVMAILASLMVPVVIRQVDRAAWTKEVSDLSSISNALVLQAVRSHSIPDASSWAQTVATWLDRPAAQITSTPRNFRRAFLIDPGLSASGLNLPYAEKDNPGLPNAPTSSRLMIVSTISADPPVSSGAGLPASDFQAIWDTPQGSKPSVAWTMSGEDICIQRINLEPLFYQLILVNRSGDPSATFAIGTYTPINVPSGGQGYNYYYLDSTVVNLDVNSTPQTRFLMKRNASYAFENGAWQGQIMSPPPVTNAPTLFAIDASLFLNATVNPQGLLSPPGSVLSAMFSYMQDYSMSLSLGTADPFATSQLTIDVNNLTSTAGLSGLLLNLDIGGGNKGGKSGLGLP